MIAWDMKVGIDRRRKSLAILKSSSMIHCLLFVQGVVVATLKIFPAAVEVFQEKEPCVYGCVSASNFLAENFPFEEAPYSEILLFRQSKRRRAFFKGRVKIEPQRGYFRGVKQKRIFLISF